MTSGRPSFTLAENISRRYRSRVQSSRAAKRIWRQLHGAIPVGMEVDHINRDWSDNRPENLRLATHAENNRNKGAYHTNTTGEKGVAWGKRDCVWIVNVKAGELRVFGRTQNKISAILSARLIRRVLHGEFATS